LIGVDFEPVPAELELFDDEPHAAATKPAAPKTASIRSFIDPFTSTPLRTTESRCALEHSGDGPGERGHVAYGDGAVRHRGRGARNDRSSHATR
jgi:hypothetical protein